MYPKERTSLKRIARILRERHGERIRSVTAFGSRVRGDHGPGSDFDLLIVVRNRTAAIENEIIGTVVDEEMRDGWNFTPLIKDEVAFAHERDHSTPFYENITREGVIL